MRTRTAIIDRLGGYDGLPFRYMVRSQFGWLSNDSWSIEHLRIHVYPSAEEAIAHLQHLFPGCVYRKNYNE